MRNLMIIATLRCKCGLRLKVEGEIAKEDPQATSLAECPNCGDQQVVYVGRIRSITVEKDETAPNADIV
jgi:hypothetical protein